MSKEKFPEWLEAIHISLDDKQKKQFEQYYQLLVEWNERMNLTGITEEREVYEKHFYDSLTGASLAAFKAEGSLIDVGSGAGFPSLPLKICFPELQVTIVDSLKKRIGFLEEIVSELGLDGVTLVHDRAEQLARQKAYRDQFDAASARAVAKLPVLLELCLPFVKPGGVFIAWKGASGEEELHEAENALVKLEAAAAAPKKMKLPEEQSERVLLTFEKKKKTPKAYPRKPGTPAKNPL